MMTTNKQKGFSLVEVMIVTAILGGLSLIVTNITKQTASSQKKFQTDIDADFIMKEIAGMFADPINCAFYFNGKAADSSGSATSAVGVMGTAKYSTSGPSGGYGSSGIVINSFTLSQSGLDANSETALIINFATPKVVSKTVNVIKPRRIKFLITKSGANVSTCRSAWVNQNDYWVKTATGDHIYYISGHVGVGTNTPTANLHVEDTSAVNGQTTVSIGSGNSFIVSSSNPEANMAMGKNNALYGTNTAIFGQNNSLYGLASAVIGANNTGWGYTSFTAGYNLTNHSYAGTAIGQFNEDISSGSTGWTVTDSVFEIGIGTSSSAKKNAMTVLKDGRVGIGTSAPISGALLDVRGGGLSVGSGNTLGAASNFSTALGSGNTSTGAASLAVGTNNTIGINGFQSIALGIGNVVNQPRSIAIGDSNTPTGQWSTTIGKGNSADQNAVAIGYKNTASGAFSSVLGQLNTTSGDSAFATGAQNIASGFAAIAMGSSNVAAGIDSVALGYQNTVSASATMSAAIGNGNNITGQISFAAGTTNTISSSQNGYAMGMGNNVSGASSVALGAGNTVSGGAAFSVGLMNSATGDFSVAMGHTSAATGSGAVAIGNLAAATQLNSVSIGNGTDAPSMYSIAVGTWNLPLPGEIFEVGSGTGPGNKRTSLAVNAGDGNVIVYTNLAVAKDGNFQQNVLVKQDITAQGTITAQGVVAPSDKRLKKDIVSLPHSLEKILSIRGVSFSWINPKSFKGRQIGLIAQEVEKEYPELVLTDAKGMKSVAYMNLVAPMIEAIREQQAQIETLKKDLSETKLKMSKMENDFKSEQAEMRKAVCESNPRVKFCKNKKD